MIDFQSPKRFGKGFLGGSGRTLTERKLGNLDSVSFKTKSFRNWVVEEARLAQTQKSKGLGANLLVLPNINKKSEQRSIRQRVDPELSSERQANGPSHTNLLQKSPH
jgi:hypothetical protein